MPPKVQDKGSNAAMPPRPSACVLGVDLGTSSVKAILLEETAQGPTVIASCSRDTQARVESHAAGPQAKEDRENEQDVHKIITALNDCLAGLPQQLLERVCRIGVSGQMHGVVFWKMGRGCKWTESGHGWRFEPQEVSHLITWQDGRCSSHFLSSLPQPQSHLSVATGFGCATIYWYLKNSPDFLKPYDAAGTIHDYVVAMLCGRERPQMSVQNAASWGYFNTTSKSWNTDILKESNFPVHFLPEVVQPGELAGGTSCTWHRIPKGTEVGAALGDFQCSVYSCMTGCTDAVLNISTSAQLTVLMPPGFQPGDSPDPRSPVAYYPYFDNSYLVVAASLNGGNVMATFVDMLVQWMAELGLEVPESDLYPRIIGAALAQTDTGLTICPTVFGERHIPERLASVTGIAASDLSLGHVTRALCHGVVQNLHSMLSSEHLKEAGVTRILASGSALGKNEVMRQEVEKAYPFPVVYGKDVDAAVGAAQAMLPRK
ncbi:sedoheptulokinase isoform X1 [Rhineura floridana]|uniref:sedoheptulokinase isoform X1 n=1 Tax=Rhineura floridana TaxID=261503 RepID=UPI002AC86581|nr:sedoheptulokinase isoform X1 [Rhineura floridana]XP_061460758.1 sedoheptulokinase isoform X1 [Rhineura floridana]XP_061460759.1 sedoheptulokinase isoform X1 [Rhineura floridana]XP_061460760.1 sedoheptulokinase isoform X1 [Rhineura floridana]